MIQLYAKLEDITPTEGKEVDAVATPEDCVDPAEFGMTKYTDWLDDIRENGIKYALKVHPNGLIADGNFRYWCAKELGYEYVPIDLYFYMGLSMNKHMMSIRSDFPIPMEYHVKTPVICQKHIGVPLGHGYHEYCGIKNLRWVISEMTVILHQQPQFSSESAFHTEAQPILPRTKYHQHCTFGSHVIIYAGTELANNVYVGDGAMIREHCWIGAHTIIGRAVTVEQETYIGHHCKIQTGAHLTGNMRIGNHVFVGPHVVTMNDKYMGSDPPFRGPIFEDECRVGANATILAGITIGKGAVIGAGAVVTKDVPAGEVWVGNPARRLK